MKRMTIKQDQELPQLDLNDLDKDDIYGRAERITDHVRQLAKQAQELYGGDPKKILRHISERVSPLHKLEMFWVIGGGPRNILTRAFDHALQEWLRSGRKGQPPLPIHKPRTGKLRLVKA